MAVRPTVEELDARWNATAAPFPADRCLHDLVAEAARRTPTATALVSGPVRLTYAQLVAAANRLAQRLRHLGVSTDTPVAICAERGVEMVVGSLAILMAGGAYVPLDPAHPAGRLSFQLADCGAPVVLVQPHLRDRVPTTGTTVEIDLADAGSALPATLPRSAPVADPETLAYVMYTSGTTGRPKGVCVPHRGVVNRLVWMRDAYAVTPADHVLQKTPFGFDVSVWELFLPLICGARLVMLPPDEHADPFRIARTIEKHEITILHFVPTMLARFVAEPVHHALHSVRHVICSGETLSPGILAAANRLFPGRIHNLYGPTEATIDVTAHHCRTGEEPSAVPIGAPIANTELHVLTPDGQLADIGAVGELFIGGVGLARGYCGRPAMTAEAFLPNPFGPGRLYRTGDLASWRHDGLLDHHGRTDGQVKISGHRIELGEIERSLTALAEVAQSVVRTERHHTGRIGLTAYLVATHDATIVPQDLRGFLSQRLPHYMVPDTFVVLDALPTGGNGKVDRGALGPPDTTPDVAADPTPRTPAEAIVASVWAEVLGADDLAPGTDVFAAGANSMLALRALSRLRRAFATRIRMADLFEHRTIATLATHLEEVVRRTDAGAAPGRS